MALYDFLDTLPADKKLPTATHLLRLTLPIWNEYVSKNQKGLAYHDSVVGLAHTVDKNLLLDTLTEVEADTSPEQKTNFNMLSEKFLDPIVSLQDGDWELPDAVLKTFYSAYNVLNACMGMEDTVFGERTLYVAINQAIDALTTHKIMTFDEVNNLLYDIANA